MNTKSMLVPLAALSLMLWTGCATERTHNISSRPVNLLEGRANTHPEMRTGLDRDYNSRHDQIVGLPPAIIVESAGSERLEKVE
jgi:hypothetical protein